MVSVGLRQGVIDIEDTGTGKPILLLHSLLADRSVFDKIVPLLASERRVIVPDLPGFGGSSSAGSTIEGIADRVAELLDTLGLDNGADVLGNGFGGFIASMLAIRHGTKVNRLVLADTGLGFTPEGRQAFYTMADLVRRSGMEAVIDIAIKRLFPDDFIAAHPEVVAQRRKAIIRTNPTFFAEACHALATLDLTTRIGTVRNRTLVVVGELDSATPPQMSRALTKALPAAEMLEIPGCGHAPMLQAPVIFVETIAAFLDLPVASRRFD